jgi:adenosylcobinamide-GDP ribazoletransferase
LKFIAAFRFLTVIPLPVRREITPEDIGGSIVYFPVVGLIIGLILFALWWLLDFLAWPLSTLLLIVAMVLINGALHLDGFIDTCDGLAGNKPAGERLRVMKDSRVGAFGVIGAALLILVKYAGLDSLALEKVFSSSLIFMPVVGRWAMVYAIVAYPYARPNGLGTVFKKYATWMKFAAATVISVALAIGLGAWLKISYFYLVGPAVIAGVWLVTAVWAWYLKKKLGGLTGDSYGAICEVAEVSFLIIVNLLLFNRWVW